MPGQCRRRPTTTPRTVSRNRPLWVAPPVYVTPDGPPGYIVVVLGRKGHTTTQEGVAFSTSSTVGRFGRTTTQPGSSAFTDTRVR